MVSTQDVDRVFLQAILSRGLMSGELAKVLWERSIDVVNASNENLDIRFVNNTDAWNEFVGRVNRTLDKLDLEFRMLRDESTGREMYALVNRKGDEIAQLATDYSPAEIAFFKAIVEQIMLAPREAFSVSSMAALRELTASKINITKIIAEVVLTSFVSKGWLLKSSRGRYSLSTRSLLELLPYLKSNYPDDLLECTICMEIVTRGVACLNSNCKVRLHYHCFTNYRQRQGIKICMACKKEWPREVKQLIPVGEDAAREGDADKRHVRDESTSGSDEEEETPQDNSPPAKASRRKGKGKSRQMEVDDEDEDEDADADADADEQDEPPPTQLTQKPRRSARR